MSAIPGSFRSLVDHSSTQGHGVQRQHIGAQILWILMMIFAPLLCPVYLIVAVCWVCLVGGRMSAETKVTIFIMMVFFSISWIPLVSLIVYLETRDPNAPTDEAQIKMVNGLTPIAAYYMFTIWGIVVAFRRFKLTDAYEIETSRRDVACLKDIIIEPKPIPIPGAREMVKALKAQQAAKRNAFGRNNNNANGSKYGGSADDSGTFTLNPHADESRDSRPWYARMFGGGRGSQQQQHYHQVPNLMSQDSDDHHTNIITENLLPDGGEKPTSPNGIIVGGGGGTRYPYGGSSGFVLPSDEVAGEGDDDTAVTINTVTDITNALELYVHLKGRPKYIKMAALSAFTLAGATVTIVRTLTGKQNSQDPLWFLSTAFFCGMFLVFYSVFAFIITMYLNQVRFIQRLTSAIVGDRNSGIAWVRAHNLSHLRAWEAVRRLAVLEITNPDSVLNSLFTPSMFLSSLACLIIAAYIILRLLFEMVEVGPFIMTLLVLFVLLLGFMILVTGVANYAQSHLKLHTSIIAQKTYEIAKLIDEKYSDIERGLLIDTGAVDTYAAAEVSYATETTFTLRNSTARARRNTTVGTNWGDTGGDGAFDDGFDAIDEHLKTNVLRNSSLADPENARAQLEMLFQERKLGRARKPANTSTNLHRSQQYLQSSSNLNQQGQRRDATAADASPSQQRSNIRLPSYFQQTSGTVAVGFGSSTMRSVQSTVQQHQQPPALAAVSHQPQTAMTSASSVPYGYSRHGSNLDAPHATGAAPRQAYTPTSGRFSAAQQDGGDSDEDAYHDSLQRERDEAAQERDTEGLERLSITALESCHASLLSLCNYFVANQPRPLILGMQLQNVRYAIVFVLLISGNLMFLALMMAFKSGKCQNK